MAHLNQSVRVEYQPAGGEAGLVIKMEIIDETGFKDLVNFPDVTMTEIPLSGCSIYQGSFTPDALGTWTVHVNKSDGTSSVIKQYEVEKSIESLLTTLPMVA